MNYIIPEGITVWRTTTPEGELAVEFAQQRTNTDDDHRPLGANVGQNWELIHTTKSAVFCETDRWVPDGWELDIRYMYFRLPPEAAPYTFIEARQILVVKQ